MTETTSRRRGGALIALIAVTAAFAGGGQALLPAPAAAMEDDGGDCANDAPWLEAALMFGIACEEVENAGSVAGGWGDNVQQQQQEERLRRVRELDRECEALADLAGESSSNHQFPDSFGALRAASECLSAVEDEEDRIRRGVAPAHRETKPAPAPTPLPLNKRSPAPLPEIFVEPGVGQVTTQPSPVAAAASNPKRHHRRAGRVKAHR